jgi:hypothetical protein
MLDWQRPAHGPDRVSHLIAMNTAPASYDDWIMFLQNHRASARADLQTRGEMSASPANLESDPDSIAALYSIQYRLPRGNRSICPGY